MERGQENYKNIPIQGGKHIWLVIPLCSMASCKVILEEINSISILHLVTGQ